MMKWKKALTILTSFCLLSTALPAIPVSAERADYVLDGINCYTLEEFEYCQANHLKNHTVRGLNSLYLPQYLKDHPEKITKIEMTKLNWQTIISFSYEGQRLEFEHFVPRTIDDDINKQYAGEKIYYNKDEYEAEIQNINGHEVFAYRFSPISETQYYWIQDGEYFHMRTLEPEEKRNPKHISLCQAVEVPLTKRDKLDDFGLRIRVVDEQGNPMEGIQVNVDTPKKKGNDEMKNLLWAPTDKNGCAYDLHPMDGSMLYVSLTKNVGTEKEEREYKIRSKAGKPNQFKITWKNS